MAKLSPDLRAAYAATAVDVSRAGAERSDGGWGVQQGAARAIGIDGITHVFGQGPDEVLAIDDVSFDVADREYVALVGPSGCGKTTLLNMVAGLLPVQRGRAVVRGKEVNAPSRDVGYISARDALLPWRTTIENVAFGLEIRGVGKRERLERAREMLNLVGLRGFERSYRSHLSQGMRQRAAIARSLATDPDILLMDEPFSALDQQTKVLLEGKFLDIWQSASKSVLMVTHDVEEAVAMADRVVMLSARPGTIVTDMKVDLPRPRDVGEIRYDARFREITHEIWERLKEQLAKLDITQEG